MRIPTGAEERRARVEIIPLLDVLLIVLIFFVYLALTMTSQRSIGLNLPPGKGTAVSAALTISIDRSNTISVDGKMMGMQSAVAAAIASTRASTGPHQIVLRSDSASSLGISIELLSRLREAGINRVSIEVNGK